MRYLVVLGLLCTALVGPGTAGAGGWATVGFAPLPDGTAAGETWTPEITVRQHGVTPLGGLEPVVTIAAVGSGERKSFTATETAKTGVYRADVVFPSGGEWRVVVDSGFWGEGSTVTYGPVAITPDAPAGAPRSFPAMPAILVAIVLALAALGVVALRRTGRLTPAG